VSAPSFWATAVGARLWLLGTAAMWATAFAFIKIAAATGLGPFAIACARSFLTGVLLTIWFTMLRRSFAYDRDMLRHMLVLGVFNSVVPNALIAVAMQDLATAPAAMIQATIPVLVVLFGLVVAVGERPRAIQLLGIGIGLCGAGIVIGPDAILSGSKTLLGSAAMFGTACSYAFTTLYLRRAKPRDMGSAALGQQFIAAPLALLLSWVFETHVDVSFNVTLIASLLGLSLIATAIPTWLYFELVRTQGVGRAALVQYLLPVFTAIYGVLLLGERLSAHLLFGGVIVLVGVWLATATHSQAGKPGS
jgi:drug/metabolite transporter (DMT)-like permease